MASLDDARINTREERPSGATSGARRMEPGDAPNGSAEIRVPRLLVLASEVSWRVLVCAAAATIVVIALLKIGFALIPVAVALLLSTLFVPPARALERRGLPRALAATLVFIGGLLVIVGLIALVTAPIAADAEKLGNQIRAGADKLGGQIADLPLGMSEQEIQKQIDSIDDRLRENNGSVQSGVVSGAQAAGQFLASMVITLVVLFFFIKDGPAMWRWVRGRFPDSREPAIDEFGRRSWRALSSYVKGVVFVALVDAVGIGLALWVIGVPLVLPLAALTFVLAFIPIVGSVVAGLAAALVALAFEGVGAALLVVLAVLVVQQLEGNVLYPVIVGRTLRLHPVVVLLAVTIGGVLYGVIGAALAVPIAVIGAAAFTTVEHHAETGEVTVGPPPVQEAS
jgi:predicted PurR-regulated permease PerM